MAREVIRERCPACGQEEDPKQKWTCDFCRKQTIALFSSMGVAPDYPAGWIVVAPPESVRRGHGNDFCSWKCAADYARQQEIAVEAARG